MNNYRVPQILVLSIVLISTTFARSEGVSISGLITDDIGSVIPDVEITATNSKTDAKLRTKSLGDGSYTLSVPAGIYKLRFQKTPFNPFVVEQYQAGSGRKKMMLDISLVCESCIRIDDDFTIFSKISSSQSPK